MTAAEWRHKWVNQLLKTCVMMTTLLVPSRASRSLHSCCRAAISLSFDSSASACWARSRARWRANALLYCSTDPGLISDGELTCKRTRRQYLLITREKRQTNSVCKRFITRFIWLFWTFFSAELHCTVSVSNRRWEGNRCTASSDVSSRTEIGGPCIVCLMTPTLCRLKNWGLLLFQDPTSVMLQILLQTWKRNIVHHAAFLQEYNNQYTCAGLDFISVFNIMKNSSV